VDARPNILFVTADHLRYDTLGHTGDPVIQTPAIDRLAKEGVRFEQFFVQNPVCQPSRATMMTGRYPRHHGVRWNGNRLDENEMTLVEFLKSQGYRTASIGKHHVAQDRFCAALDVVDAESIRRGWRERPDGDYTVRADGLHPPPNPFEAYVRARGYEYETGYALPDFRERLGAVPSDLPEDCHLDAYVGMKAREYLEGAGQDTPFFLWLGFYGPHHPYVPSGRFAYMYDPAQVPPFHRAKGDIAGKPPEYRLYIETADHKYRGFPDATEQTFREMKAAYYGMVSQLDWQLGLTLDALDAHGLAENTIVVFTSDHGEFLGDHGIPAKAPFLLDCMLHVPCIIRAPGAPQGASRQDLAESVDLFPTIARLAGLEPPQWVQGTDLCPRTGNTPAQDNPSRAAIYAEAVDKRCVRTKEWKYIHYSAKPYGELYHLTEDPHELNNLYDQETDVRKAMRELYYAVLDRTEDFRHPTYDRFTGFHPETGQESTHYHTW
jgi:arylsulfatase A-like enzyme